ncbi:MAG: tetratricopeptide repeat protein [Pseudomonadota bacterium]
MSGRSARPRWLLCSLLICTAQAGLITALGQDSTDPLTVLDVSPTEGAAPDYLDDAVCGTCHRELFESFQDVGMAQSFRAPQRARLIERFGEEFVQETSQRHYRIDRHEDGRLRFTRYQLDQNDEPINQIEIDIDWVLGSGNRARSYLYQTEHGELFMLPLSWYSEIGQWRMSPGFEHAFHQGVNRKVSRPCLFCHNAYPEVPAGSDSAWQPHTFPETLPEGIGCQRCHGPGAPHVRQALSGGTVDQIHAAITNPAKLPAERRDSVCFQCHLLPAESVEGVRNLGRGVYSFRPGERLADYLHNVDIATRPTESERFEINHHGYRLSQSACYRESDGALSCISCHNPHEKSQSVTFRQDASAVCRECHANQSHSTTEATERCVDCHMPTRRTGDVIEVTMTDHKISTGPFDADRLRAPVQTREPVGVADVTTFEFREREGGTQPSLYPDMAALRSNRLVESARRRLGEHLGENHYDNPEPYIDLAKSQIALGELAAAEQTARRILSDHRNNAAAYSLLGTALLGQRKPTSAAASLRRAAELSSDPETHFNLAAAHLARNDIDAAEEEIDRALELRPLMATAWKYRGLIKSARGDGAAAESALRYALAIEPADTSTYIELINVLRARGKSAEAERYFETGLRVSANPSALRRLQQ